MKVVILCGGLGSRLSEETKLKPKPMVKIGKKPILVHIMETYKKFGFNDFILAGGYKYKFIEKYFQNNKNFNTQVVNTGAKTLTGKRIFKLKKYLKKEKNFMLTYGDGLTNQNLSKLLNFHLNHKRIATITAVRPPVRFGELVLQKNKVKSFKEKPQAKSGWINGGFFIFKQEIFNFIKNKNVMLEREPLNNLTKSKQLIAYQHNGFWQCMETMRDKRFLENLIKKKSPPWTKVS